MGVTAGQLLREARLRHGLTQKQLAMRVGTTQSAISRIERDQVSPTIETLQALLAQLGEELVLGCRDVPSAIDRTLYEATLRMTPEERLAAATAWGTFVLRNRGIAGSAA
jgi:transcriptional regulator with XRE-family HTH domain